MAGPFFGRSSELTMLRELLGKRTASLVVLRGRRRIGKSRLAEEYGRAFEHTVFLAGLPPEPGVGAKEQRQHVANRLGQTFDAPPPPAKDWDQLLAFLAKKTAKGRTLVVLDEITWMGRGDPTFLGKLKTAWDLDFKANPELVMVLSGSVSGWIERNILSSTGFLGRVSLELELGELPLPVCAAFWGEQSANVSAHEKLRFLAVSGGVPRYLEEMLPTATAEANIRRLCFRPQGLLFHEFDRLFSDLFAARAKHHKALIEHLVDGSALREVLLANAALGTGGTASEYLDELVQAGFVTRDHTWNLKTAQQGKPSRYRLKDNYLRFYLKYVLPNRHAIMAGDYAGPSAWPSIVGLQMENLMLGNRRRLHRALAIESDEIVAAGPYFQPTTKRRRGCQIDYMIQTRHGTLYLCEAKFGRREIGFGVVDEVRERLKRLQAPKHLSFRPVLIHASGVAESVVEERFFANIIDFTTFLQPTDDS